jgi:hypothetical protein
MQLRDDLCPRYERSSHLLARYLVEPTMYAGYWIAAVLSLRR